MELIYKEKEKCLELKNKARILFSQQKFGEAADIYNEAIDYCTLEETNMLCILNSNIAICLMKQSDYKSALEHCVKALEFNPEFIKALLNRTECDEKTEKLEEALEDYKKLKELHLIYLFEQIFHLRKFVEESINVQKKLQIFNAQPKDNVIMKKSIDLDLKVQQLQEKRKNEALKRLKDLGNTLLGNVGINLDNFKLQKNENGLYNIQYQQ